MNGITIMSSGLKARFEFTDVPNTVEPNSIVIRDIGHSDGYASITNDAEGTVKAVLRVAAKLGEPIGHNIPPIYYYDSDGRLDQLEHDGSGFMGFKAGPLSAQIENELEAIDRG